MSLRAMLWVMEESDEKLARRLVLLALADHAHDDGSNAFPSLGTIARKAGITERHARSCLKGLEGGGAITRDGSGPINKRGENWTIVMGEKSSPDENVEENPSLKSENISLPYIEEPSREPSAPPTPSPVETIWDHFIAMRAASPKPVRRYELDSGTRRMIQRALEVGSEEEWSRAVYALLNSPHHLGKNDRGTAYLEPRHVFTACTHGTVRGHLDWLLDLAPQTASPQAADGGRSSALAVRIREAKRKVLVAYDLAGSDEAKRNGDENEAWLAEHGVLVVRSEDGRPTFRESTDTS